MLLGAMYGARLAAKASWNLRPIETWFKHKGTKNALCGWAQMDFSTYGHSDCMACEREAEEILREDVATYGV